MREHLFVNKIMGSSGSHDGSHTWKPYMEAVILECGTGIFILMHQTGDIHFY